MDPDDLREGGPEAGSGEALKRLFELHAAELYRFAYRYVRSAEVAKDLVHEAFLRLWRQRSRVDLAGATARSYLHTIVRYQALDHLRRRRIEDRWRREYLAPALVEQGPLHGGGPEEDLAAKEIAQAIGRAVAALPQRQQQVLLLRWQHHASYDQIAVTLGISPKTVGVHFTRGIQRLRELLAKLRY